MRTNNLERGAWSAVLLLWIAFAVNYVDRQLAYSIFPALRIDPGFTQVQLGLIGTVFLWSYGAAMMFTGRAADRWDNRKLIVASVLLWSSATAASGLSSSPGMFLAFRAVVGVSEALYFPAAMSTLARLHTGATRSTALSLHQSAQLAGIVAGGWYGGWAADHIGWRTGYVAVAIAGIIYAGVLIAGLRSGGRRHTGEHTGGATAMLRSRCFIALALAFMAFCAMLWIFYAWLPNYLYERHRLSMEQSGLIATAWLQGSSAVGLLGGGFLADRLRYRFPGIRFYIASAGLLLSPAFCFGVFRADTVPGVIACCIGFGLTAGLMQSSVFAAAYDVVPSGTYGSAAAWLNVLGSLGGGTSVLLAGSVHGVGGLRTLAQYSGLLTAVAGAALLIVALVNYRRETYLAVQPPSTGKVTPVT